MKGDGFFFNAVMFALSESDNGIDLLSNGKTLRDELLYNEDDRVNLVKRAMSMREADYLSEHIAKREASNVFARI